MPNNPAIIVTAHDPVPRMRQYNLVWEWASAVTDSPDLDHTILRNGAAAWAVYERALSLLRPRYAEAIAHLAFVLTPVFGKGAPGLRDQKIGGVPDLRGTLPLKHRKTAGCNTRDIWPRCGVCHRDMRFLAQVDLLPWLAPLHSFIGEEVDSYGRTELRSVIPRQLTEDIPIFRDEFLHIFVCPDAAQHFDHPGYDVTIFVSNDIRRTKDEAADEERPADREAYLASVPKVAIPRDSFKLTRKKIVGWEFRLEFDDWRPEHWPSEKAFDALVEGNPDVFHTASRQFKLFGEPASQQEPRRFLSTNSYKGPHYMIPLIAFDDEDADMTYQIYADLWSTDGFTIYGKVDASCT